MPAAEAAAFAARTGCLFIGASAKMAAAVTEAFNDDVVRIIDTPSLWREEKSKSSAKMPLAPRAGPPTPLIRSRADQNMPGKIDLSQMQDENMSAGCLC